MSNYKRTMEEVQNDIIARVPLIIMQTAERERAERLLRHIAVEQNIEILYYTDARQVRSLSRNSAQIDVDRDPLPFVVKEFLNKRRCTFALGDCRKTGEDTAYTRELLNLVFLARESRCTLILITADPVWPRLGQFGMHVRLDYPDMEERREQIAKFVRDFQTRFVIDWTEEDVEYAATLLRGFSEAQINNILSTALVEQQGLDRRKLKDLAGQKSRVYAGVPSIQPVQVRENLRVSGLQNLKNWLKTKKKVFFTAEKQLKCLDLEPPQGILLVGVSGCGKSLSAKMVAAEWGLPLYRFDLGSVYDKWVGESEKKMRDALQFLDNVAPCVVWIDEIEKALAVSDGGNDVGRRVLGQFLFWLQESGNRVFLVATANDISALPPELFRKGRFSELFFVDLPNDNERGEALLQYCGKSLNWQPGQEELAELIRASEGFSYADIEFAVKDLAEQLLVAPGRADKEALLARFAKTIPYSRTNAESLEELRAWGRERAVNASEA